jgi:hypothetical protein
LRRYVAISAVVILFLAAGVAIGGTVYWHYLRSTPQYSLALLVDAAKQNDQAEVASLVDSDAVVDDLLPQVIEKAVEIYGRGQSTAMLQRAMRVAAPLMPAAKEKARAELPGLIRRETEKFGDVAFPLMVLGADRYLDIHIEGDTAFVKSKRSERSFETKMVRDGERWKIVAIRDEQLAGDIAKRVGQEIIAAAMSGKKNGFGLKSIDALIEQMRQAQE